MGCSFYNHSFSRKEDCLQYLKNNKVKLLYNFKIIQYNERYYLVCWCKNAHWAIIGNDAMLFHHQRIIRGKVFLDEITEPKEIKRELSILGSSSTWTEKKVTPNSFIENHLKKIAKDKKAILYDISENEVISPSSHAINIYLNLLGRALLDTKIPRDKKHTLSKIYDSDDPYYENADKLINLFDTYNEIVSIDPLKLKADISINGQIETVNIKTEIEESTNDNPAIYKSYKI